MKPLLAAPLTDDDFDIYVRMAAHYRKRGYQVLKLYDDADRRDANLMLWRVEHVYYSEWERREDLRDAWITPQGWWHPL